MLSTKEVMEKYVSLGENKVNTPFLKTLLLAVIAGFFIALAGVGANAAIATIENPSIAKLISAVVFPAGLSMVSCAGCELFTGDSLIVISLLDKKIKFSSMLKCWIIVYIGNLIGSVLIALLASASKQLSLYDSKLAVMTISIAVKKTSLSFSQGLFLGIGCNFLVCIAVLIALSANSTADKIAGVFFPILLFVVSGFEHSVANMYYIPAGIIAKMNPEYLRLAVEKGIEVDRLNISSFLLKNLLPVTIGNLIGGTLVGLLYWYIYLRKVKNKY